MAFTNWLKKLNKHSQNELLEDLVSTMTNEQKAKLIDDLATELNDDDYEWEEEPNMRPLEA